MSDPSYVHPPPRYAASLREGARPDDPSRTHDQEHRAERHPVEVSHAPEELRAGRRAP